MQISVDSIPHLLPTMIFPILVDTKKFTVQNLTNTIVQVQFGIEIVWCLLSPLKSNMQKIACASIYSKPLSHKKSMLLDHIYEAFHFLRKKFGNQLQFIMCGEQDYAGG